MAVSSTQSSNSKSQRDDAFAQFSTVNKVRNSLLKLDD